MPRSMCPPDPCSLLSFSILPMELHIQCIQLTCSSDLLEGSHTYHTALSLCLVSKYYHSITTPILYHKLFLAGRSRILQLSQTFRAQPHLAAFVSHALLSDRRPRNTGGNRSRNASSAANQMDDDAELEVPPTLAFEMPRTREARVDRLQRLQSWLTQRSQALSAFRSAVLHILALTSPNLRTLAILLYGHYDRSADSGLSDALAIPYPVLSELTACEATLSLPWSRIVLPSLQSLHLACGTGPSLSAALNAVETSCPGLIRLRFTEPLMDATFTTSLSRVLSQAHDGATRLPADRPGMHMYARPRISRLPIVLQRLVIQPTPFHFRGTQDTQDGPNLFQQLIALAEQFDILKLVPPAPTGFQSERYPLGVAMQDWFGCMRGGQGCKF